MSNDTSADETEHWSMDYEPVAASRYNGDHDCQYEDCDETADWLIDCKSTGYTGGRAFFCCQPCSRKNRIYAKENELNELEVDADLAEIIPDDEIQHVDDFAGGEA